MARGKHFPQRGGWLRLATVLVFAYLYAPIAVLVAFSFNSSRLSATWQGTTLSWYAKAFNNPQLLDSLRTSLRIAFVTTVFCAVLGTLAALVMGRHRFRGKTAVESVFYLPVVIPEIVVGFASVVFFGLIGFRLGFASVVAAHVAFSLSYVVFVVRARLSGMDERLEEAALDLGATPMKAFFRVTLPLLAPGIVAASLLVFTLSLDDYIITSFTAGQGVTTLPLLLYSMMKTGVTPEINAVSTVLLAVTVVLAVLSQALQAERKLPAGLKIAGGAVLLVFLAVTIAPPRGTQATTTLNIYIWSNYTSEKLIREFENRYKCRVNIETYDSNEALLAKLQTGLTEYDLIVPSDYMVGILIREKLIQPIDRNRLANFGNLDPTFLNRPFDPGNGYSVPYTYVLTGIGYRKDKIRKPVDSWDILWDTDYRNRIAMLDDVRECFGVALRRKGYSLNSKNERELASAAGLLAEQKKLVKTYDSATFDQLLLSGEAWIVQGYNGQVAKAAKENPNIAFIVPKEGGTRAIDCLAIPKNAPHPELALRFIDYVLEPEASAEIVKVTGYGTPNPAARPFVPRERLEDPAIYPPREILDRCEFIEDVGAILGRYDYYWTEVKTK